MSAEPQRSLHTRERTESPLVRVWHSSGARLESLSTRWAIGAFVVAGILMTVVMYGSRWPLAGSNQSVGNIAAWITSALAGLSFATAYVVEARRGYDPWRRRLPMVKRVLDVVATSVAMGMLSYLGVLAVASLFQLGFHGLTIDPVIVYPTRCTIDTIGDALDVFADHPLSMIEYAFDAGVECLQSKTFDDPYQLARAHMEAGDLRVDVAVDSLFEAAVRQNEPMDIVDSRPPFVQLDSGDDHAFLVHIRRVGAVGRDRPDIEPMRLVGGIANQFAGMEHGHDQSAILGVGAGAVRLVINKHIARFQYTLPTHGFDGAFDAKAHRTHEQRLCWRLRQQPHVPIVENDREIQRLINQRGERCANRRLLHLIRRGIQCTPYDLGTDRVGHRCLRRRGRRCALLGAVKMQFLWVRTHSRSLLTAQHETAIGMHAVAEIHIHVGRRRGLIDDRGPLGSLSDFEGTAL